MNKRLIELHFMDIKETLNFIEKLLKEENGQGISDIQRHIIEDLLNGKTYKEIAKNNGYDEGHIGDVSRNKIFKAISKQLKEDVNKYNFRWVIEKAINSPQYIALVNAHNNYCVNSPQSDTNKPTENEEQSPQKTSYQDLKLATQIIKFYSRESELKQLENWVFNEHIKLISILGLRGIGKSILVKKFVDLNLQAFEVIIWKNLKLSNSFDGIITDILTKVNPDLIITQDKLSKFLELLKSKRCLIILDNIEELFMRGKFAGIFKTKYKGYQDMLRMITEIEHQSTLILISQEQCSEMGCLEDQLYPIQCLELKGLYSNEIMEKTGLQDLDNWDQLINLYEGNPVYLKDIVYLINNIFGGKVSDFLAENTLFIPKNMQCNFKHLFDKLSSIEQQIVLALSKFEQSVSREKLRQNLELSSMDLINGLQSLQQRYLITKIKKDKILFSLNRVFREYVSNFC